MAQQVTAWRVHVHRHIRFLPGQEASFCDLCKIGSECLRVQCITETKERWQTLQSGAIQAIEVGKISGLVDPIYVCFLRGEGDVFLDLRAYFSKQILGDEVFDHTVLIAELCKMTGLGFGRDSSRFGGSIIECVLVQDFLIEETFPKSIVDVIAADCSLLA